MVFVADHGESLGEHGIYFEHHMHVYEETVHVPLAIRLPKTAQDTESAQQRIDALVSPMDLASTVLDFWRFRQRRAWTAGA